MIYIYCRNMPAFITNFNINVNKQSNLSILSMTPMVTSTVVTSSVMSTVVAMVSVMPTVMSAMMPAVTWWKGIKPLVVVWLVCMMSVIIMVISVVIY